MAGQCNVYVTLLIRSHERDHSRGPEVRLCFGVHGAEDPPGLHDPGQELRLYGRHEVCDNVHL